MNTQENEMIELGAVSEETRGQWLTGPEDMSTGMRLFIGGIQSED